MPRIRVWTQEEVQALNAERARVAAEELAERRRQRVIREAAEAEAHAARQQRMQEQYDRYEAERLHQERLEEAKQRRLARERADAAVIGPGRRALDLDD
ncbi:hypothetical protein D5400_20640 [Georhizobium profundi]|uniref:Uncharacterized protein n=1 Tax=Georhizobium profundi TaxID=2341112 RepID=A0A3S9B8U3_9HYPH|nr:hypothetical protein [Georhizobium profundi]AZN73375.1 hypothetical protein D5400_20640 [Georhizobium profundi]